MFPQETIPVGVQVECPHQNHPYYSYQRISPHPHTSIQHHPHKNITPHHYTRIPPHPFGVRPYCAYTRIYETSVVPHYPHIPSFGYIHK